MRTVLVVGGAALCGALGVLAVQSFTGGSAENDGEPAPVSLVSSPQGAEPSDGDARGVTARGAAADGAPAAPRADLPRLMGGPRFNPGRAAKAIDDGAAAVPAVLPSGDGPAGPDAVGARPAASKRFEEERRTALATFDRGDRRLGATLLEGIYAEGRDQPEIDLSAEVARLLVTEESFPQRLEYADYLVRKQGTSGVSVSRFHDEQMARAQRLLARVEGEPDLASSVWEELTVAYALAADASQRRTVLAILEPFLERMVFSGRYSPLLRSHTVSSGESLERIARRYGTTVGAVKRLNKLASDTIQPRQRLRVLEGTVRIAVLKREFRLFVTVNDRLLFDRPVGLGRDNATPVGVFAIGVRQENPTWWRPGEAPLPPGDPRNVLGSRWLGFRDTDELAGFGIHGTSDAASIGKESSAGCVRLRNEDIELIYDFVPPGTEVDIRP